MNNSDVSPVYRAVMRVSSPVVKHWGRLEVIGEEHLPAEGPVLLVGNHDSYWDPVAFGTGLIGRRQVRALAKSTLWKYRPVAWVVDRMGQIPIERGKGDATALSSAIAELKGGACIGIFPEGTISRGAPMRARSGVGRLAQAVPEAKVVLGTITGSVDIVRFPKRPAIRIELFEPEQGQMRPDESPSEFSDRVMADIRRRAPYALPGRKRTSSRYRTRIEAGLPPKEGRG
ncbi:1-acyl-sn-glycerol-3-phosphate acyltransferase [Hoyosella sp. G463]|uniref:1-acyl-sn-glycerol-3-phosphate acyltransferase n=2 Tax=Lolliginicoccus lacisalsi TaxID=2742202 RepID=A0A927JAQ3_9ACTN|nr:1-acyl-sn-glycerol-3-phosphate acyltransferase [Lolliginicoccus lacisalsi]